MHTIKQASILLGVSERTVKHYRSIYVNEVLKETDGSIFLTDRFIEKVQKVRSLNAQGIDNRNKAELLAELNKALEEIERIKSEVKIEVEKLKAGLKEAVEVVADYENSEVYEKAEQGQKIEVFTLEEYEVFSERLTEWRIQRKEIELITEQKSELKDDKEWLRLRNAYLESSNNKILEQHQLLIEKIGERNRIEAVEKGVIPKQPMDI
jgi:DNA repair ATPase RecN